jgi:hypothetical protein
MAAVLCVCATFNGAGASPETKSEAPGNPAAKTRVAAASSPRRAHAAVVKQRDGTLLIAGRSLRCGSNRNVLDRHLPNLGLAAPGVLIINPREISPWSDTVRLFVYHHECGHHHVGGSEIGADCWAAKQGVRDGWLTREGLVDVCRSFGNGPATDTHPAGARRCAALQRCFATAVAALTKEKAAAQAQAVRSVPPKTADAPKLVREPSLKRSGMLPSQDVK